MSNPIMSKGLTLVDNAGKPVAIGDMVIGPDGVALRVLGGTAPRHPRAEGKVYVQLPNGYKDERRPRAANLAWRS